MASIAQLIADLESRGVILSAAEGEIRFRGPKGALTDTDRESLKAERDEILDFLQARAAGRALRNITPRPGPFTASVVQEMWNQFGGGDGQGQPITLNIGMAGAFPDATPEELAAAIRAVAAGQETLLTRIRIVDGKLNLSRNDAAGLDVSVHDLTGLDPATARQQAMDWCRQLILVEDDWLLRAAVFRMPDAGVTAVITIHHIVSDAGSRETVLADIRGELDRARGRPLQPRGSFISYNDFALAEREFLAGPQGDVLIDYWRRWNQRLPRLHAPSDGRLLTWGAGTRIVRNFKVPRRVHDAVQARAAALNTTPFLVYLAIFSLALGRWARASRFAVRVLGDKRSRQDLARTVGLMYCADPVDIELPANGDFAALVKSLLVEYEAALALRLPTLHYWVPHCVRPGIEAPDYPNHIPAVFNYYSGGPVGGGAASADAAWPPVMDKLPPQRWVRRSAPVFLHLVGEGSELNCSLHFLEDVVPPADQDSFVATFFQVFAEQVPV